MKARWQGLPSGASADLARAAKARAPYDVDRGLERLAVAVGAAGAAGAAGAGAAFGAKPAAVQAIAIAKGAFWGLAAVGSAGAIVWASARGPDPVAASAPASASTSASANAGLLHAPTVARSPSDVAGEPPAVQERAEPPEPRLVLQKPPSVLARSAPAPDASALAREVRRLAELRAEADADPARALDAVERDGRDFRGGALGEDREAIAIDALVALGRTDEAKRRASAFVAAYPRSTHAKRMRGLGER